MRTFVLSKKAIELCCCCVNGWAAMAGGLIWPDDVLKTEKPRPDKLFVRSQGLNLS